MDTYMTTAVTVKNITFKEGETLICVPLIGKTLDELLTNAQGLVDAGADIIEWRVDHLLTSGKSRCWPHWRKSVIP